MKMKSYRALGPNLIIKVNTQKLEKIGSLYIPEMRGSEKERAREEAEVVQLGETAFDDLALENRPKVGDMVVIPSYEGRLLGDEVEDKIKETTREFEYRVVADTRVLCVIEKESVNE